MSLSNKLFGKNEEIMSPVELIIEKSFLAKKDVKQFIKELKKDLKDGVIFEDSIEEEKALKLIDKLAGEELI